MTANRVLAIACAASLACLVGGAVWMGSQLRDMRSAIADVSDQSQAQLVALRSALDTIASRPASDDPELAATVGALEFKTVGDIKRRVNQLSPQASIEEVAKVIAEMDQWLYGENDAIAAGELLEKLTAILRSLIENKVQTLLGNALQAADGGSATAVMSEVNDLLSLYPVPTTAEQKSSLHRLTEQILSTSRRIEEIRRLRYNAWAISQIESGLSAYRANKGLIFTNDAALVDWCLTYLKEIDPAYLEPVTLDLYNYVIGLTAKKVDDQYRVRLAEGFADIESPRRTLADF